MDKTGASSLESAVHSINWGHAVAGIEVCSVCHALLKFPFKLEDAKRS